MSSRLSVMIPGRLRRALLPLVDAAEGERRRLAAEPRRRAGITTLLGEPFRYVDAASFLSEYCEIYAKGAYDFKSDGRPRIIDCGANCGVAVRRWKLLMPDAEVEAYEADPEIVQVLRENTAGLGGVVVQHAAVWKSNGFVSFAPNGADGGTIVDGAARAIDVPAVSLAERLGAPVALLKMDIEGAEVDVLNSCKGALGQVERIFVEFHSFDGRPQRLEELIDCLAGAGFRLTLASELMPQRPFLERCVENGKDLRLNIFGRREGI